MDTKNSAFSVSVGDVVPPTITYHGLNCWYTHIVEKYGWVVAHKDDYSNRIQWYIETVGILLRKISEWETVRDNTTQITRDLIVMKTTLTNILREARKMKTPVPALGGGASHKTKAKKVSKTKKPKKASKSKKASKTRKY